MALIVSSSDLHEARLLVSVTGSGAGDAPLVFDLGLCAKGRDSTFYRTTVAVYQESRSSLELSRWRWALQPP